MKELSFTASVELDQPIVVATQAEPTFPEFHVTTSTARLTLSLDVDVDLAKQLWEHGSQEPNYWVNACVGKLHVAGTFSELREDQWASLHGHHPTARRFTGNGQEHQEVPDLGEALTTAIADGCNHLIAMFSADFGQYWLRPVGVEQPVQNTLCRWGARWRDESGIWHPLWTAPRGSWGRVHLGVADQYLSMHDAELVAQRLREGKSHTVGYALLSEGKRRWDEGDRRVAIVHVSSAVEWAVQGFLESYLTDLIPEATLGAILRQAHGRLLDDWVLPISRSLELGLEGPIWESIKKVQRLRREAGHPSVDEGLADLTHSDFVLMCDYLIVAISNLVGCDPAKGPPYLEGSAAAGLVAGGPAV